MALVCGAALLLTRHVLSVSHSGPHTTTERLRDKLTQQCFAREDITHCPAFVSALVKKENK